MPDTLVIQSQRRPLPQAWLEPCLESVENWARANDFEYRFIDDSIFADLDSELRERLGDRRAIASDLARLWQLQGALGEGYRRAIWCDADFLVFDPERLLLPREPFVLGREVWVQRNASGGLKCYRGVHNAMMMFTQGNTFLDFYAATAERLLRLNDGPMAPQFIGPKLLSALHNIARFPLLENAAMLSPLVMRDLLAGGGEALDLWLSRSSALPSGANLCSSLSGSENFGDADMLRLIGILSDPTTAIHCG